MTTYKLQFEGLGFSEDAAKALIEAGLDSFVEIASLTEDDVSSLLRSLRKPGGGRRAWRSCFYLRNV
jgi:predicted flap endonuclease-1-like 5' DNA nuclease